MTKVSISKPSRGRGKWLCLLALVCMTGCDKKDLSPPPINLSPQDSLAISLSIVGNGRIEDYRIEANAEYGNMSRECSKVDWRTGVPVWPRKQIHIANRDGTFNVYRDYYENNTRCQWSLFGFAAKLYDRRGRNSTIGIPSDDLKVGYSQVYQCEFIRHDVNVCLPDGVRRNRPGPRIRVKVHKISK